MGVRHCSAINCVNNSKWNKNLSFFRFPKDPKRLKQWLQACRRKDIMHATVDYAHNNLLLCSKHFSDACFMNVLQKDRLVWDAVPSRFDVPNPSPSRSPKRKAPATRSLPPPPKKRNIANHNANEATAVPDTDGPSVMPQLQDAAVQTDFDNEVKLLRVKVKRLQHTLKQLQAKKTGDPVGADEMNLGPRHHHAAH